MDTQSFRLGLSLKKDDFRPRSFFLASLLLWLQFFSCCWWGACVFPEEATEAEAVYP